MFKSSLVRMLLSFVFYGGGEEMELQHIINFSLSVACLLIALGDFATKKEINQLKENVHQLETKLSSNEATCLSQSDKLVLMGMKK